MIATKKIKVDLNTKPRVHDLPVIDAVQGDGARSVAISLYSGSSAWTVPTGTSVQIRFQKPDGTGGSYDTLPDGTSAYSISGSTVTVHLAPEMMTVSGVTQMQVVILSGSNALATFTVMLSVEPDPSLDTLESKDFVNHIGFIRQEIDRLYSQTFVDGGYIGQKMDDLHEQVQISFEKGALNTSNGLAIQHDDRIRSGFIPSGGRQITVIVPEGAKVRCFFYDANRAYTGQSAYYSTSFTLYSAAYVRCEAAYSDDFLAPDMDALADKIAIFFRSSTHDAFQGNIRMLGCTSFAECSNEGYYQFDATDLSAISDAPEISTGGILEVHSHAELDVPMQTIRTTDGDIWFRWGTLPFRRFLPQKQGLKWFALGDDIAQGYYSDTAGAKLDAGSGWAALVAKYNGWELTNYAVVGSGYVRQGADEEMPDAPSLVDTIDFSGAELVTLAFGINDWMGCEALGSMETNMGTVYGNMRRCIEKILSDNPCAKIVVISPINCCAYGNREGNWAIGHALPYSGTLEDIFNAEREVCEYYGIELIDLLHGSVVNRLNAPELLPDGIHPSLECHKQLALELSGKLLSVNPVLSSIKPIAATADMTQSVGVDTSGKLWTAPGGGSDAVFDVIISGNAEAGYAASKTLAEIFAVHDTLNVRCVFEDNEYLPLVYIEENNQANFAAILEDGKTVSFVKIDGQGNVTAGSAELGAGAPGEDGGYYIPSITQIGESLAEITFSASKADMPEGSPKVITLPAGPRGEEGGYYRPSVTKLNDNEFVLTFYPSKAGMPYTESVKITAPSGPDGKPAYQYAQDGGYTGTEEEFAEKLAAELPNIAPIEATTDMTQSVGVDAEGKLWTVPGGGSDGNISYYETTLTMEQDVTEIAVPLPCPAKQFFLWNLVYITPDTGATDTRTLYVQPGGSNINFGTTPNYGSVNLAGLKFANRVSVGITTREGGNYEHTRPDFAKTPGACPPGSGSYIGLAAANSVVFPAGTQVMFWGVYEK